jgi:hypothetical protein
MRRDDPTGYQCDCGKFNPFSMYVCAHWNETLNHKCVGCGRQHEVTRGFALALDDPAPPQRT